MRIAIQDEAALLAVRPQSDAEVYVLVGGRRRRLIVVTACEAMKRSRQEEASMRSSMLLVLLAGCATSSPVLAPAGPSVESVTQEAQVCGDVHALHAGDWIQFQRRVCSALNAKSSVVRCAIEDVDRGEVLRIVDARCASVRVAAGVVVRAGDTWSPVNAQVSAAQTR